MPALTTAAACRNADTGVAAAIASGNQAWNGSCAALVNAPSATSTATVDVTAASPPPPGDHTSEASMSVRFVVPVAHTATPSAANSSRPPVNVSSSVRSDPASPEEPDRAMSRNDAIDTSSQPTNSSTTSSDSTSSSTASMNAVIRT